MLAAGEGYLIDNRRMLHGRRAFTGPRIMHRIVGNPLPHTAFRPGFDPAQAGAGAARELGINAAATAAFASPRAPSPTTTSASGTASSAACEPKSAVSEVALAAAILTGIYAVMAVVARYDTEFTTITQLFAGYLTIGVCMFWGAPLVARDIENGTSRLAWTQSKTRAQWLTARLTVAAAGAIAAAAAVTALITWALPATTGDPMRWYYYETHDLIPFVRVLFALTLGAALGAITRHTHIAMAVSVPILGILQLGGARALRENSSLTYWQLQLSESGLYLAAAIILAAITFAVVRRLP